MSCLFMISTATHVRLHIGGRGLENVLKINNQRVGIIWGFKNRIHVCFNLLLSHFL